ncbi:MAG: putative Protein kinase, partial [Streblomastix strix]
QSQPTNPTTSAAAVTPQTVPQEPPKQQKPPTPTPPPPLLTSFIEPVTQWQQFIFQLQSTTSIPFNTAWKKADFDQLEKNKLSGTDDVTDVVEKTTHKQLTWKEMNFKEEDEIEAVKREIKKTLEIYEIIRHSTAINAFVHVAQPLGFFLDEEDHKVYLVREFCVKGNLRQFIEETKQSGNGISQEKFYEILGQIALSLKQLHSHGILHADLKPENILFTEDYKVKITNFGHANQIRADRELTKASGGKSLNLAPETLINKNKQEGDIKKEEGQEKNVAKRLIQITASDVWAFGLLMFELLTYKHPFFDKTTEADISQEELEKRIINQQTADIPDTYPQKQRNLVKQMLAKDPLRRITLEAILALPEILLVKQEPLASPKEREFFEKGKEPEVAQSQEHEGGTIRKVEVVEKPNDSETTERLKEHESFEKEKGPEVTQSQQHEGGTIRKVEVVEKLNDSETSEKLKEHESFEKVKEPEVTRSQQHEGGTIRKVEVVEKLNYTEPTAEIKENEVVEKPNDSETAEQLKERESFEKVKGPEVTQSQQHEGGTIRKVEVVEKPNEAEQVKAIEPEDVQPADTNKKGPIIPSATDCQIQDTKVIHSADNSNICVVAYDPVITDGIYRFEGTFENTSNFCMIGIADASIVFEPNVHPGQYEGKTLTYASNNGALQNLSCPGVRGNQDFTNKQKVAIEVDMVSNPRKVHFFLNDWEQRNSVFNIPPAVRFLICIYNPSSQFTLSKFDRVFDTSAQGVFRGKEFEWGKQWEDDWLAD